MIDYNTIHIKKFGRVNTKFYTLMYVPCTRLLRCEVVTREIPFVVYYQTPTRGITVIENPYNVLATN